MEEIERTGAGWQLVPVAGGEPLIADLELGRKLGYKDPASIRKLIERLIKAGKLSNVRQVDTVSSYESRPGVWQERTVRTYQLNEEQTLKVIAKSETTIAPEWPSLAQSPIRSGTAALATPPR